MHSFKLVFQTVIFAIFCKATFCQDISMHIDYPDTIYFDSLCPYFNINVEVTNNTKDTYYLEGFRMSQAQLPVALPDFILKRKEFSQLVNEECKQTGGDFLTILSNFHQIIGRTSIFIKAMDRDSLIGLRDRVYYNWFDNELIANYDTSSIFNPYHLGASQLFRFQRTLILPPYATRSHYFSMDLGAFHLEKGKKYKLFLAFSFDKFFFRNVQKGISTWYKINSQTMTLISNEVNLTW